VEIPRTPLPVCCFPRFVPGTIYGLFRQRFTLRSLRAVVAEAERKFEEAMQITIWQAKSLV
jgi:hypothetical protein